MPRRKFSPAGNGRIRVRIEIDAATPVRADSIATIATALAAEVEALAGFTASASGDTILIASNLPTPLTVKAGVETNGYADNNATGYSTLATLTLLGPVIEGQTWVLSPGAQLASAEDSAAAPPSAAP